MGRPGYQSRRCQGSARYGVEFRVRGQSANRPAGEDLVRHDAHSLSRHRYPPSRKGPRVAHRTVPHRRTRPPKEALRLAPDLRHIVSRAQGIRDAPAAIIEFTPHTNLVTMAG